MTVRRLPQRNQVDTAVEDLFASLKGVKADWDAKQKRQIARVKARYHLPPISQ
jgi:hypothetical protein